MSKKALSILLATAGLVTAASSAHAADGTITIMGEITSQTCSISGNGGGKDFTVDLPTVSTSALSSTGTTAGRKPFKLSLTNCTSGSGNVSVYFEPGTTVNAGTGNLLNATGTAKNVEIGLLNKNGSSIKLGAAQAQQNSQVVAITGGSAELEYAAQYVAMGGAATAGTVNTSVMYSIAYQ
ncbi:fimbrial protein [Burkholderia ubonensis]|uniref:Fimbrial protein n=1 Tax=Burkholderia ubonensis TaxID=101571 RepID=A0AAW3MNB1_9BURK|nr:fimbrial protein [Burkholderia ubonensis]KVL24393.1 fimbrial protein [Burkholderia ubonensis]KVO43098.1 fimbrial protein [Burkholderia ubonensis]KVP89799.1 fimbrial protein [Burkholderia ubonensis]KVQ37670.1 fimbrial protein [Burkholderia ubonensis]KVX12413.1 fimbrial protein [Burkholderia ubonensis]